MRKKIKVVSILLFLIGFIIIGIIGYLAYDNIFKPAYYSTISGCELINEEDLNDVGYYVVGTYNATSDYIEINIPKYKSNKISLEYVQILKHEQCHQKQMSEGRLDSCWVNYFDFPIGRYFDEVECYYKQYL